MKKTAKYLKKKLSHSKGFSLVEMLFSILILMLSTTVIIQCFNLGVGNMVKETRASEAELLCSALTSSLQNELTYAQNIKIKDGKLDTYFSASRRMGEGSRIVLDEGMLIIKTNDDKYPLVASSNYTSVNRAGVGGTNTYFLKAYLYDNSIQWDSDNNVFKVELWVDDATKTSPVTELTEQTKKQVLAYSEFSVKPLAGVSITSN